MAATSAAANNKNMHHKFLKIRGYDVTLTYRLQHMQSAISHGIP